jgi:hypothetical protein
MVIKIFLKFFSFRTLLSWFVWFSVTFYLLLNTVWKFPIFQNLQYNLIFATTNTTYAGHIVSYLAILVIPGFVNVKTGNILLGFFFGGLVVAIHELIWMPFYYVVYWSIVSLEKEAVFLLAMVMFVFAFKIYSSGKLRLFQFKWVVIVFAIYCAAWFAVPHLFFGYSNWLPIRTADSWFWNPYVNLIEIIGWILPSAMTLNMMRH